MGYITPADLKALISAEDLTALLALETEIDLSDEEADISGLDFHVKAAQGIAASYLSHRFDTEAEWEKTGTDRDYAVLVAVAHIALFLAHGPIAKKTRPDTRVEDYNAAIAWLASSQKGEKTLKAETTSPAPEGSARLYGSGNDLKETYSY